MPSTMQKVVAFLTEAPPLGRGIEDKFERLQVESWLNFWFVELRRYSKMDWRGESILKEFAKSQPEVPPSYFYSPPELEAFHARPLEGWLPSNNPFRINASAHSDLESEIGELSGLSRPELAQDCAQRLYNLGTVVVTGSVGSGKHALVHSNVLPLLKSNHYAGSGDWLQVFCSPGEHAMTSLANALRAAKKPSNQESPPSLDEAFVAAQLSEQENPPLLIVVEHFEEIFKQNAAAQESFCKALTLAHPPHRTLIVLRSNCLELARQIPSLQKILHEGSKNLLEVPNLSPDELRNFLEITAKAHNVVFESGLVDTMLNDVAGDPAALITLRFTMMQLWDRIEDGRIYEEHYHAIGRTKCFEKTAEQVYKDLLPKVGESVVKAVWMELIKPDSGSNFIFERRTLDAIVESTGIKNRKIVAVMDALTKADLIHKDGQGLYTFAHPVLAPRWTMLVNWVNDSRRKLDLTPEAALSFSAQLWQKSGRPLTGLYVGKLSEFNGKARDKLESEFLAASRKALLGTRWFVAIALVACISFVWWNRLSTGKLISQTYTVQAQRALLAERGRENPAEAVFWLSKARDEKLAWNPWRKTGDTLARELNFASPYMPVMRDQFWMRADVKHAEFHPIDNEWVVMISQPRSSFAASSETADPQHPSPNGSAVLWRTNREVEEAEILLQKPCTWAAFSPDGAWLAIAGGGKIILWTVQCLDPAFRSADDSRKTIQLGSKAEYKIKQQGSSVPFLCFDHKSQHLAAAIQLPEAHDDNTPAGSYAYVWKLPSAVSPAAPAASEPSRSLFNSVRSTSLLKLPINHLAFSPDNRLLALSCGDIGKGAEGAVRLVSLDGTDGELASMAVLQTNQEEWTKERDPEKKEQFLIRPVRMVTFSPDGRRLVAATGGNPGSEHQRGAARLVEIRNIDSDVPAKEVNLTSELISDSQGAVMSARFSPDGDSVLLTSADGKAAIVTFDSNESRMLTHQGLVYDGCFSPDGTHVATGGRDGVRVWDAHSAEPTLPRLQHPGSVSEIRYSPDGRSILAVGDQFVRIWGTTSAIPSPQPLSPTKLKVLSVFTNDHSKAVAGIPTRNGGIEISYWDTSTPGESAGHPPTASTAFKITPDIELRIARATQLHALALSQDGTFIAAAYSTIKSVEKDGITFNYHLKLFKPKVGTGKPNESERTFDIEGPITRLNFGNQNSNLLVFLQESSTNSTESLPVIRSCENVGTIFENKNTDADLTDFFIHKKLPQLKSSVSFWEVSANDEWLAIGSGNTSLKQGTASLVPLRGNGELIELALKNTAGHQEPVTCIAISPRDPANATFQAVSGSADDTTIIWKIQNNTVTDMQLLEKHPADVTSVAFDPKGKRVLSTSQAGSICISDVSVSPPRRTSWLSNPGDAGVSFAVFSPDEAGSLILSVSADRQARVWDPTASRAIGLLTHYPRSMIDKAVILQMEPLTISTVSNVSNSRPDDSKSAFPELRTWTFQAMDHSMKTAQTAQVRAAQVQMGRSFDNTLKDLAPMKNGEIDDLWNLCQRSYADSSTHTHQCAHDTLSALAEASGDWFAAAWHMEQSIARRNMEIRRNINNSIAQAYHLTYEDMQKLRKPLAMLLSNEPNGPFRILTSKVLVDQFFSTIGSFLPDKPDSLEELKRVIAGLAESASVKPHLHAEDGVNWRKAGDLWFKASEWQRAKEAYDLALQNWPDKSDVSDRLNIMAKRAKCHLHLSRLAPNNVAAYQHLAWADWNCKDAIEERAEAFSKTSDDDAPKLDQMDDLFELRAEVWTRADDIYHDKAQPLPDLSKLDIQVRSLISPLIDKAEHGNQEALRYLKRAQEVNTAEFDNQVQLLEKEFRNNLSSAERSPEDRLDQSFSSGVWQRLATLKLKIQHSGRDAEKPPTLDTILQDSLEALKKYAKMQDKYAPASNKDSDPPLPNGLDRLWNTKQLELLSWAWVLAPDAPHELREAMQNLHLAIEKRRGAVNYHYFLNTLGAAYYRFGDYDKAIQCLEQSCESYSGTKTIRLTSYERDSFKNYVKLARGRPQDWVLLSMAHAKKAAQLQQQGKAPQKELQEARIWLALAQESAKSNTWSGGAKLSSDRWVWNEIDIDNLLREAEGMLNEIKGAFDRPAAPAIQPLPQNSVELPQPQASTTSQQR